MTNNDIYSVKLLSIIVLITIVFVVILSLILDVSIGNEWDPYRSSSRDEIYKCEIQNGIFVGRMNTDDRNKRAILLKLDEEEIIFEWHSWNNGFFELFEYGDTLYFESGKQYMFLYKENGPRFIGKKWHWDDWDKIQKPKRIDNDIIILN